MEDLATAADAVPARRRAKSRMADGLPTGCGVYQFLSRAGQVLYVGSAVNLHRRVRSYFTAAEKRTAIARMLDAAAAVRTIETATEIEARVRELRLIAELSPPTNRRSRAPHRQPWIHLVNSPEPHLATTTTLPSDEVLTAIGPFPSRSAAREAIRAAESVLRLRAWDGRNMKAVARNDAPADAARLKNLTSQLIGRFVSAVAAATRDVFGSGPLTRYDADLIVPDETAAEILILKGAAVRYVMAPREHEPVYLRQRTELFDLADALLSAKGEYLEPVFASAWREADDDAGRVRAVVDQIASLTDTSARAWHARLCGLLSEV